MTKKLEPDKLFGITLQEAARMGGNARAKSLSPEKRAEIAQKAGKAGKGITGRRGWPKGKARSSGLYIQAKTK